MILEILKWIFIIVSAFICISALAFGIRMCFWIWKECIIPWLRGKGDL